MLFSRAGPEDTLVRFNFLIRDARIIGNAARAGATQFLEDLARLLEGEVLPLAQELSQFTEHLHIGADVGRGVKSPLATNDAPLQIGHSALFFRPLCRGKHYIGELSSF